MSIRRNRYGALFCRSLLLAGYLFLFAGQFSYRYFSIANFYVYSNSAPSGRAQLATHLNTASPVTHLAGVQQAARVQHGVALHDNGERPTHLSIDKRFHLKQGVRVPQIRAPGLPDYIVIETGRPALEPVYPSTDLPVTSLRGPPCA
jgi:hypothetical protein